MRVILTHEQADFDAMGALLGAALCQEHALPVLPRKTNRNVQAFLTLYGADLPFVDPRDLPAGPIESVLLVDTQSLVTLKNVTRQTRVEVIDHHQLRSELPPGWTVHTEPLGAVTTLFVEELQDTGVAFTPAQSSLLLLGIYEDTGSLSYASTTPRDVRAAAYLLEQGASLAVAARYLNPPLSADQRMVYDRLLASAQALQINGQKIIITCASADDMHEEVSSVAHKLRDLLDPDALFLLVTTGEGIRLVARSTTSRVNVAAIAAEFGGGGHERAAAALIRPDPEHPLSGHALLEESCGRLIALLPGAIQPPIRVGQIMSHRPRLISPQTSSEQAAALMQRYGYEGFPVVAEGRVLGLLTRRAVDRAISHHLNLDAAALMDAGEITILPDQSLESLQQLMTSSGWGQVPVLDPATGAITGIVTRTDLLKSLAHPAGLPSRQNLAEKLENALPPTRLAFLRTVADKANGQRMAIYIVGGFVRDLLLDRPSQDFDVVVEGDAISLARSLAVEYGGQVVSHARFGTAKWTVGPVRGELVSRLPDPHLANVADLPESLDLVSARTEFYERPSALPVVERGSIKLDLHRRDFTINTLALRLDGRHYGELYDYWGGLNDLKRGIVRVLHSLSFIDDPTRMLRAVRFEQRFGFHIESRTLELLHAGREMLKQVSGDRLRHELDLILAEPDAGLMLARLAELGILEEIHPALPGRLSGELPAALQSGWSLEERCAGLPTRRVLAYLVWLAALSPQQAAVVASRLRFPSALATMLQQTCRLRMDLAGLAGRQPSAISARLDGLPLPVLLAARQATATAGEAAMLDQYVAEWRSLHPATTGDDLRRLGLQPGPRYKAILAALREAWLDGSIHSPAEEQALLGSLLAGSAAQDPTLENGNRPLAGTG